MIPNEKIKQVARIYSTSKNKGFEGAKYIVRSIASEYDFTAGVEFAEAELKNITCEFAEWCAQNAKPTTSKDLVVTWKIGSYQ